MLIVAAVPTELDPVEAPEDLANGYGVPCAFAGCRGFFHPAHGATGVVLCSPWGYEDLAMRKSWRLLAEAISRVGYPCLRFDYPGTGDSLGQTTDPASAEDWIGAIDAAADVVRRASGVKQFIFVGQSLGAALAVEAASRRGDVAGLHLIAPVVKGRAYLRELAATARLVADKLEIAAEANEKEALNVVGFALSRPMAESLKGLDLTKVGALGVDHVVIYDQADRKAAAEFAEHVRGRGIAVDFEAVPAYHLMVSDATVVQPLPVAMDRLVALLQAHHPVRATPAAGRPALAAAITSRAFVEEPVRFGPDQSLFGILCTPAKPHPRRPAVVLLNRGLNQHIGWRRVSVDHARGLAAAGIASLRIDVAGLGESRDAEGRPQNLIYSELLIPDIKCAVDVLVAQGHGRIALAGVCSGAYMALIVAAADPRVSEVISVNPQRFLWNPRETFEDVIRFGLRSMNDYVGDIKSRGALRKLIRSRRRIAPAVRFLAKRYARNTIARVPLRLRSILMRGSMSARVAGLFATFAARGTRIALVYSAGDPGLMELRTFFGRDGRDMPHANVSIAIVPDADHNLTTGAASNLMLDHMIAVIGEAGAPESSRAPRFERAAQRAVCPT